MTPYRFTLVRSIDPFNSSQITFIGLNPSTADDTEDDQTTKKLMEFTDRWGYGKYLLLNLYPYRATDHRELVNYMNEKVSQNRRLIKKALRRSDLVVPMWGRLSKIPRHLHGEVPAIEQLLKPHEPECFGKNQDHSPKHPLMLPYTTKLVPY